MSDVETQFSLHLYSLLCYFSVFPLNIYIILQPEAMLSKATVSGIESHCESHSVVFFFKLQHHKWPQGKVWAQPESGKRDPNTAVCAKTMSYLPCFILISKPAESKYVVNSNVKDERLKAENSPHYSESSSGFTNEPKVKQFSLDLNERVGN